MTVDFIQLTSKTKAVRFLYFNEVGEVWNTLAAGFEAWDSDNYALYLVTVPHIGQGRYQVATPAGVLTGYYSFAAVQYIDGTEANDLPLGAAGESADVRYVDGDPVQFGAPGGSVTSVTVVDAVTAVTVGGVERSLTAFQNTKNIFKWKVADAAGAAVDLTGHTIRFVVHLKDSDSVVFSLNNGGGVSLEASDPDNAPLILDQVVVTIPSSSLASPASLGVYDYKVWDLTAEAVYGSGSLTVKRAPRGS